MDHPWLGLYTWSCIICRQELYYFLYTPNAWLTPKRYLTRFNVLHAFSTADLLARLRFAEMTSSTHVIQVTNVSPSTASEQMRTLFGFLGNIEELKLFPPEWVSVEKIFCFDGFLPSKHSSGPHWKLKLMLMLTPTRSCVKFEADIVYCTAHNFYV